MRARAAEWPTSTRPARRSRGSARRPRVFDPAPGRRRIYHGGRWPLSPTKQLLGTALKETSTTRWMAGCAKTRPSAHRPHLPLHHRRRRPLGISGPIGSSISRPRPCPALLEAFRSQSTNWSPRIRIRYRSRRASCAPKVRAPRPARIGPPVDDREPPDAVSVTVGFVALAELRANESHDTLLEVCTMVACHRIRTSPTPGHSHAEASRSALSTHARSVEALNGRECSTHAGPLVAERGTTLYPSELISADLREREPAEHADSRSLMPLLREALALVGFAHRRRKRRVSTRIF